MRDRYPRTLQEAFGPYTSPYFDPEPPISLLRVAVNFVTRLLRRKPCL
jgi:hypothetical protein